MWGRALCLLGFAALAVAQDYFPLAVGNRWEYTRETTEGNKAFFERRVEEITGTEQLGGATWFRLQRNQSVAWSIRMDERGRLLVWNRSKQRAETWVDFSQYGVPFETAKDCTSTGTVTMGESGVVTVRYLTLCSDRGILAERYKPGVGLLVQESDSFVGPLVWKLVKARINGKDLTF